MLAVWLISVFILERSTRDQWSITPPKGKKERIGRLIRMYADRREDMTEVYAGDIGAVLGFKECFTGDTLCDPATPVVLENITFPEPVISIAIEPKTTADQEKMGEALSKLSEEDPTFRVHTDENTGQTIIDGMGELHWMFWWTACCVNSVCRPMLAARGLLIVKPSPRAVPKLDYKYVKQSGGHGQYGHVVFNIEPVERGAGIVFENKIVGGSIPKEYIPAS